MADTTPVPFARSFSFRCAGVVCSARGLCGLLVVFPAPSLAFIVLKTLIYKIDVKAYTTNVFIWHENRREQMCVFCMNTNSTNLFEHPWSNHIILQGKKLLN